MGLGEHGTETLDSLKCGKFPGRAEGLQTVTSNCVQFRTPTAPKIQIFTLWNSVNGRDMNPHAFKTSELNGEW